MKLSEVKNHLSNIVSVNFILPDGNRVPAHFHITEVGKIQKDFIDCGGTIRSESVINFQLWEDADLDHRLAPQKLINIINLSETKLGLPDEEIEVEYQAGTIGKFGLEFNGTDFLLTNKKTACLANDQCGIPVEKEKLIMSEITQGDSCTPGGGCC